MNARDRALGAFTGLGGDTDTVAVIRGATVLSVNRLEFGPLVDELLALRRRTGQSRTTY